MLVNAIRFRTVGEESWHGFKLNLSVGRLRNFQALVAEPAMLKRFAEAFDYAVSGTEPTSPCEVQIQLSDHGGHAWVIHRRPGLTRFLKDGTPLDAETAASQFAASLLDLDGLDPQMSVPPVQVQRYEIRAQGEHLMRTAAGAPESPMHSLKELINRQLHDIANDAAQALGIFELAEPKRLARFGLKLESLHTRYLELERQHAALKSAMQTSAGPDLQQLDRLNAELELILPISELATPLLAPGAPTVKDLRSQLAKADAAIAEISHALGLPASDARACKRDFRKAIEALSRLEAHAKLVRASQGARKYCEQNIEPLYHQYLQTAESSLSRDRQTIAELESCLASLTLRLRTRPEHDLSGESAVAGAGLKTWFERFKSRQTEQGRDGAADASLADLETAKMAIEYALSRLAELGRNADQARAHHESALTKLDDAHEELVRNFGRLRDHWITIAREAGLPEDLDLDGLMRIVAGHGRLIEWLDRRRELADMLRQQTAKLTRLRQLVLDWRKVAGSQKVADLEETQALLQEARDIMRYRDAKLKLREQLLENAVALRVESTMTGLLDVQRARLLAEWQQACSSLGVDGLEARNPALPEAFKRAQLVRALALVHHATLKAAPEKLFDGESEPAPVAVYTWFTEKASAAQIETLRAQLEQSTDDQLRLLLIADAEVGAALAALGIGQGLTLKQPPAEAKPQAKVVAPAIDAPAATPETQAALLTARARRTLDLLSGKTR